MNKEITWNIINSLLAGGLVFLGGCVSGRLTWAVMAASLLAAGIVALTKFSEYWKNEEEEYQTKKLLALAFIP